MSAISPTTHDGPASWLNRRVATINVPGRDSVERVELRATARPDEGRNIWETTLQKVDGSETDAVTAAALLSRNHGGLFGVLRDADTGSRYVMSLNSQGMISDANRPHVTIEDPISELLAVVDDKSKWLAPDRNEGTSGLIRTVF